MSNNVTQPGPLFPELTDRQTVWVAGIVAAALVYPICPWWAASQLAAAYVIWDFMRIIQDGHIPWRYKLIGGR